MKLTKLVVLSKHFSPSGIANIRDTFTWNIRNGLNQIFLSTIKNLGNSTTDRVKLDLLNTLGNLTCEFIESPMDNWLSLDRVTVLKNTLDKVAENYVVGPHIEQLRNVNQINTIARCLNSFTYVSLHLPENDIDLVYTDNDIVLINKLHPDTTNIKGDNIVPVYGSKDELHMVRKYLNNRLQTTNMLPEDYNHLVNDATFI